MEYLEIVDEQGKRRHIKLDRARYLIGREASCDICLPHPNVSRRHAQLQRSDKVYRCSGCRHAGWTAKAPSRLTSRL